MNIDFPFHFDGRGQTAVCIDDDRHIRDMIEQFLFTNHGERVNRPEFGSGLLHQVFAPNSNELGAVLQMTTEAGLQQWLGDVIEIRDFSVTNEEEVLRVDLKYRVRRTQALHEESFTRNLT